MKLMDLARDELAAGVMAHLLSKRWAVKSAPARRETVSPSI